MIVPYTLEVAGGSVNGINTVFTTSRAYVATTVVVFINGLLQPKTWTENGNSTVTLNSAPRVNDVVEVGYCPMVS